MNDELIAYTKSLVNAKGKLTYAFQKGDIIPAFRRQIKQDIAEIDQRLGLDFKKVKPGSKADLIIGYGEIPSGAKAVAVWDDTRWTIRLPLRYYGEYIVKHEIGHVLGFGHVPMGSKSLMAPGWNGYANFTRKDWKELITVWGVE